MIVKKNFFTSKYNTKIYYGEYLPETSIKAVMVFVHGIFETFEVYENFARKLIQQGIGFISFDYRGFGKSEGTRAFVKKDTDWIDDLDILFQIIRKDIPSEIPLFYSAYSMGSIIGLRHILQSELSVKGIILAATGYSFTFPVYFFCKVAVFINRVFPNHYLRVPRMSGIIRSHDFKTIKGNRKATNRLYPSIGDTLLKCMTYIYKNIYKIIDPVYIQCSKKDFFFRSRYTLFKRLKSKNKKIKLYTHCKHDIYKEVKKIRKKVYTDVIHWINDIISNRQS